jgi:hypothetical protein
MISPAIFGDQPARALAGLDELGLDDETRQLFLAGNAIRVYGLAAS